MKFIIEFVVASIALGSSFFLVTGPFNLKPSLTWEFVEPFLGITTLLLAISIRTSEFRQERRERLAKRLTVYFLYPHSSGLREPRRIAFACEYAYLAAEGDIRTWGQQIGGQMAGNSLLRFEPAIEEWDGVEGKIPGEKKKIVHYRVVFQLNKIPDHQLPQNRKPSASFDGTTRNLPLSPEEAEITEHNARVHNHACLHWECRPGEKTIRWHEEGWLIEGKLPSHRFERLMRPLSEAAGNPARPSDT